MKKIDYKILLDKYLIKSSTPEEDKDLFHWLRTVDTFHSWADEQWELSADEIDPDIKERMYASLEATIGKEPVVVSGTKRFRSWLARAAVLLLFILNTGIWIYYNKDGQQQANAIIRVDRGQKVQLTLPDGTLVWLNSESVLTYGNRFDKKERTVQLTGEGYFEVATDPARPFIVETPDLSVEALGTSFVVKNYPYEKLASSVLVTGKINAETAGGQHLLTPNQRIIYNKETKKTGVDKVADAGYYYNWKDQILSFEGETFENIAHTLTRYYNLDIIFESESLKRHRFTGKPGNTSLESILQYLSLTSPLTYEIKDSIIILRENINKKKYYERLLKE
ncbi:MAG: DUF4974 domain-containing protein [Tannerellaceae bacterium]|nr:DUF4974 domain-containing protein [Tannerellaceae bacterium]